MMKKLFLIWLICSCALMGNAQVDSLQPPYRRFPTIPPFNLLLTDSTTKFTKEDLSSKKPLLIIVFSPECEHCKHETEAIIQHIDQLKHVQIVMATLAPFNQMKEFYDLYELSKYKNITVGREVAYMLPTFFNMRNFPYLAFYDKKGKLINTFEGSMNIDDLIKIYNP